MRLYPFQSPGGVSSGALARAAEHHLVRERRQSPPCDERGIEVAHRAGGGVARVGEYRFLRILALAVRAFERRARQVHFAAHLNPAPRSATQTERNGANGPDVR